MLIGVKTVICVKPREVDIHVSGSILDWGVWEENVVGVMKMMDEYKEAVFLDIGANIGMYTVMVAAMGRKVIAVDPVLSNLALIHNSLSRVNNNDMVSLINNPIRYIQALVLLLQILDSDKRSVYFPVTPDNANEGGTKLVPEHLINKEHLISGSVVESITLQDLILFSKAHTAIIKMDVEVRCK